MNGIASRLQAHYNDRQHKKRTEINVPYRRASDIDLDAELAAPAGSFGTLRLWRTVVTNPNEPHPAREFSTSTAAEFWLLNGQTHNTRSDRHFGSKKIGLDGLQGHLVVEVELDGLSPDAKSMVTSTTRSTRVEREIGRRIEDAVDRVLSEDDQLQALSQQLRDAAFERAASQRIAGLEKALRAFGLLFTRKKTKTVDVSGPTEVVGPPVVKIDPPPPISPLHDHPRDVFQFRTASRSVIKIKPGKTASVQLEVDAADGYFDGGGLSLQFVPDLGEKLRIVSRDSLEGGRMRIWMTATKDAPLVSTALIASCLPPNAAAPFSASIPVEIVKPAPPKPRPTKETTRKKEIEVEEEAPPLVIVAYQEHDEHSWDKYGLDWTPETVGEYRTGIAYVNGDYAELAKLRKELPKERHGHITNIYVAPVGMTVVGLKDSENNAPDGVADLDPHYLKDALRAAALSSLFAIRYMNREDLLDRLGDDE